MSPIQDFISEIQSVYASGNATEHSYRPAIQSLINSTADNVQAINEPKRIECGAPDFIVNINNLVIGYIEAKDIDVELRHLKGSNLEQKQRYLRALPNLIYTNGLDWEFYRDGQQIAAVSIGDFIMGIQPKPDQFETLQNLLTDFIEQRPQTITSPQDLAQRMAGKANLIKDVLAKALRSDEHLKTELGAQFTVFKDSLIHDISIEDFADIYAETIAYGMFAARLHDPSLNSFSRQEALELLPKSNPFLRNLFTFVAGYDLDDRIKWIIDDLADVFRASDVAKLMEGFGKLTGQSDPFLHFYETFLAAYNPKKRKARGVWYTPEPVVNFIVRAVDQVLINEFGITKGLADTSKITIERDTGETENAKAVTQKQQVHRVQILDPATGTGTFLAEVIKQIAPKVKGIAPGMWDKYIEQNLIPRLHGFELLMASYAMCHMKLDMILTELGYKPTGDPPRLGVYLTNSLEEGLPDNQALPFAHWLAQEAEAANTIKRDTPIMCVIGNPPYSGHSSNNSQWINDLMGVYKQSPELKLPAQAKWLSDDYVKFIRMSENLIEKNGYGVLGFITNHAYLDNPTFLDMRRHLMESFDKIYVLDLHGNAKKKEVTPEGKPDKNVFDIMQGVAIIVALKKGISNSANKPAIVLRNDLWGTRKEKYNALENLDISDMHFTDVTPKKAPWIFKESDWDLHEKYYAFPSIPDWFSLNGRPAPGIVTTHDQFAISWSRDDTIRKVEKFLATKSEDEARSIWKLCSQNQWNYERAINDLSDGQWHHQITPIDYRPFDKRWTVYDSNVAVHRRDRAMRHMLARNNVGLTASKINRQRSLGYFFLTDGLVDFHIHDTAGDSTSLFPLYLYPDDKTDQTDAFARTERQVNFDPDLWARLREMATDATHGAPDELQTFDYIYGVLHCPDYRETYGEFLKIDFPRIPWPASPDLFWDTAAKGAQLRKLHLMDQVTIGDTPYPFIGDGDGVVDKPTYENGRVYINAEQYFDSVPAVAWGFYIGGYQPAQKWLKDRKGRALSFDDVQHYQQIIKTLCETDRIMRTIRMG